MRGCLFAMVTDTMMQLLASPGFRITILKPHTYAVMSCSQVTDLNQAHNFSSTLQNHRAQ